MSQLETKRPSMDLEAGPPMRHLITDESLRRREAICGARLRASTYEEFLADIGPVETNDCVVCAEMFGSLA